MSFAHTGSVSSRLGVKQKEKAKSESELFPRTTIVWQAIDGPHRSGWFGVPSEVLRLVILLKKFDCHTFDGFGRVVTFRALVSPRPAWVENVPRRFFLLISTLTGVVVSESIDFDIPQGPESVDQQRLPQGDPDILDNEVAANKVLQFQVLRLGNGFRVLLDSGMKNVSRIFIEAKSTLARPFWNSLANIDWNMPGLRIHLGHEAIRLEWTFVVETVDAGTDKSFLGR
tara:strand:- start:2228 stop:2911 length:684 start_codon:yes stop_codon:yes gene_type:complete